MAEINGFKIEYRLDATVQINGHSWAKPGVSAGVSLDDIPEPEQLKLINEYLMKEVVEPLMDEIIATSVQRTVEAEMEQGHRTK